MAFSWKLAINPQSHYTEGQQQSTESSIAAADSQSQQSTQAPVPSGGRPVAMNRFNVTNTLSFFGTHLSDHTLDSRHNYYLSQLNKISVPETLPDDAGNFCKLVVLTKLPSNALAPKSTPWEGIIVNTDRDPQDARKPIQLFFTNVDRRPVCIVGSVLVVTGTILNRENSSMRPTAVGVTYWYEPNIPRPLKSSENPIPGASVVPRGGLRIFFVAGEFPTDPDAAVSLMSYTFDTAAQRKASAFIFAGPVCREPPSTHAVHTRSDHFHDRLFDAINKPLIDKQYTFSFFHVPCIDEISEIPVLPQVQNDELDTQLADRTVDANTCTNPSTIAVGALRIAVSSFDSLHAHSRTATTVESLPPVERLPAMCRSVLRTDTFVPIAEGQPVEARHWRNVTISEQVDRDHLLHAKQRAESDDNDDDTKVPFGNEDDDDATGGALDRGCVQSMQRNDKFLSVMPHLVWCPNSHYSKPVAVPCGQGTVFLSHNVSLSVPTSLAEANKKRYGVQVLEVTITDVPTFVAAVDGGANAPPADILQVRALEISQNDA